jgi:error-prone DNA polymerase
MAVTLTGTECWDIPALEEVRLNGGMPAVRAAMEAGDVLPGGVLPGGVLPGESHAAGTGTSHAVYFANGFAMSRYAETGSPGAPLKHAPRSVWHASPGSAGLPPGVGEVVSSLNPAACGESFTEVNCY